MVRCVVVDCGRLDRLECAVEVLVVVVAVVSGVRSGAVQVVVSVVVVLMMSWLLESVRETLDTSAPVMIQASSGWA